MLFHVPYKAIRMLFQEENMDDQDQTIARLENELKGWKSEYRKLSQISSLGDTSIYTCIQALPDPAVLYNANGNVLFLNDAFTEVFGWTLERVKNRQIDFVPKDKYDETASNIKRVRAGEKIRSHKTTRYTRDGKLLNIQLSASLFHDSRGNEAGSVVIYRDITQSRQVKQMLDESEERYRLTIEAAADPIIVYDDQGRVTYFNQAFSRVFKWSLSERLNKKMDDFVPKENWPETREMIEMVKQGRYFSGIESARYDRDGNIIPVSISGSTYKDKHNRVVGSIINLQDISDRKQAEASIKSREKLKGVLEMAGAVCHELSQPAMIIEGYADLFLMNMDKNDPLKEEMGKLKKQIMRIGDLAQKLTHITSYKTREYGRGTTIVDIDRASTILGNKQSDVSQDDAG